MLSQWPDYLEWKAKRGRSERRQRLSNKLGLAAIFLALFAATYLVAWKYLPQSMELAHIYKRWGLEQWIKQQQVYYPNCATARALGRESIRIGEPGYRPELDADHDGIACEPIPPWAQ